MRHLVLFAVLWLSACGATISPVTINDPGVDVARAALRGGSPQEALQVLSRVLARNPLDDSARVLQGDAYTALGQFDQARDSYNAVLAHAPNSVGAEIGLGRIRLTDDPAAAEAWFLKALNHDPRNTIALNDLGIARDLQGHHAGAQQSYRAALGINPDLYSTEVNLALSMAMTGQGPEAVRMLRPLAARPGASLQLRHDLAAALTMAGDRSAAAKILSADLSPDEVQRALDAYASARATP